MVLCFNEATVYSSDIDLLEPPNWLNDNIISFYTQYLQHVQYFSRDDLLLLTPTSVFVLLHEKDQEDLQSCLDGLELKTKKLILFPLNDNKNVGVGGGSHWSLLVYEHAQNSFFHFDSSSDSNITVARNLVKQLSTYLLTERIVSVNCPQQNNGYDCGVYVLEFSEQICIAFSNGKSIDSNLKFLDEKIIKCKRDSLKTLIREMMAEEMDK